MRKLRFSGIFKLAVVAIIVVCSFMMITNRINSNELAERQAALEVEVAAQREIVASLQHRYDTPFDKDFITRLAKEKLDLVMPDVTVFHNDLAE